MIVDLRDYITTHTNQEVINALHEFAKQCDAANFEKEADMENALVKFLTQKHFVVKNQVDCDGTDLSANNETRKEFSAKGEFRIDVVVATNEGYFPIELKLNENSETELKEDIKKISHYKHHYKDITDGCLFLITNDAANNPWKTDLDKTPKNPNYSYVIMKSKYNVKDPNAISFSERWRKKG